MGTRQNGRTITSAKVEANNAVYATLMDMLKDAKTIFIDNEAIRKHFIYSALEKLVKRDTATGLRISVKEGGMLLPVTTTTIVFQPDNVTTFVDAKGIATVKLSKGVYSYIATTPGFATVYGSNIKTSTGVMHRIELLLNKQVAVV